MELNWARQNRWLTEEPDPVEAAPWTAQPPLAPTGGSAGPAGAPAQPAGGADSDGPGPEASNEHLPLNKAGPPQSEDEQDEQEEPEGGPEEQFEGGHSERLRGGHKEQLEGGHEEQFEGGHSERLRGGHKEQLDPLARVETRSWHRRYGLSGEVGSHHALRRRPDGRGGSGRGRAA